MMYHQPTSHSLPYPYYYGGGPAASAAVENGGYLTYYYPAVGTQPQHSPPPLHYHHSNPRAAQQQQQYHSRQPAEEDDITTVSTWQAVGCLLWFSYLLSKEWDETVMIERAAIASAASNLGDGSGGVRSADEGGGLTSTNRDGGAGFASAPAAASLNNFLQASATAASLPTDSQSFTCGPYTTHATQKQARAAAAAVVAAAGAPGAKKTQKEDAGGPRLPTANEWKEKKGPKK